MPEAVGRQGPSGRRSVPRGLFGVVHLPGLPGDPLYEGGGFAGVERRALEDAAALAAGGAVGLVVENFGSAPFSKESVAPHVVAAMARVAGRVAAETRLPVVINCLRNDARSALSIAAALDLFGIRVNIHTGAYVTDQGLVEGRADETLRLRRALEADSVRIFADVLVKHAAPLAPLSAKEATQDTLERGLADAVVVTGTSTGAPIDLDLLREVRAGAGERPVVLGSGVTPESCGALGPYADAAIVGTWLKEGGVVRRRVETARVRAVVEALAETLRGRSVGAAAGGR